MFYTNPSSYGSNKMDRRPLDLVYVVVLSLACLASLLAGCGGPTSPEGSNSPATPVTDVSNRQATMVAMVTATTNAIAGQVGTGPGSEIEAAILSHLVRRLDDPYKDVKVKVLSQDDAFATAEVRLFLRKSEAEPWQEQVATMKLKRVSGEWEVDDGGTFESALAPQMTATVFAEMQSVTWLRDIHMVSATDGWAVGYGGQGNDSRRSLNGSVVLRYRNGKWEQTEFLANYNLNSIYMISPDEGWAVGYKKTETENSTSLETLILHYKGGKWQEEEHPELRVEDVGLTDVQMLSAAEGWAVGGLGDETGTTGLLHYKDGKWSNAEVREGPEGHNRRIAMRSIHVLSPTEGWAVGEMEMMQLKDGKWERILSKDKGSDWGYTSPAKAIKLRTISILSANEGWAAGLGGLLHYTNGSWERVLSPSVGTEPETMLELRNLQDIQMLTSDNVWAVGNKNPERTGNFEDQKSVIAHYTGGKWQEVEHPIVKGTLSALHMLSPDEGWAVGFGGTILQYRNSKWESFSR